MRGGKPLQQEVKAAIDAVEVECGDFHGVGRSIAPTKPQPRGRFRRGGCSAATSEGRGGQPADVAGHVRRPPVHQGLGALSVADVEGAQVVLIACEMPGQGVHHLTGRRLASTALVGLGVVLLRLFHEASKRGGGAARLLLQPGPIGNGGDCGLELGPPADVEHVGRGADAANVGEGSISVTGFGPDKGHWPAHPGADVSNVIEGRRFAMGWTPPDGI